MYMVGVAREQGIQCNLVPNAIKWEEDLFILLNMAIGTASITPQPCDSLAVPYFPAPHMPSPSREGKHRLDLRTAFMV